MNFTLKDQDATSARLVVSVQEADYAALVEKTLKNIRQKANIPGFRPGMVPMGLIKKQYGTAVKAEEINKLLQTKIYEYIRENNVDILGEPLPDAEQQSALNLVDDKDFDFEFRIALAPKFDATLTKEDKLPYYIIEPTEEMIEGQAKAYAQRCGEYKQVESYESGDMLKGTLVETIEGGIDVKEAVMMPSYMKNDDQKAIFNGAKVNDVLVFNPNTAFDGNEAELSTLLKIKRDEVADMKSNFSFQIEEITRAVPAAIDQALFDQVFGEGAVSSEEEFRGKIKAGIAAQFEADSNYKFLLDVRTYTMNKVGKMEFSEPLLKKIMLMNNQEKGQAFVDENYEKSLEELSWYLIKEQLVEANGIKVEQDDLLAVAKENTRMQFAQYGMNNLPEEMIENYAKEQLKKKENVEGLVNRAVEVKLAAALKSKVALNNKEVTAEEFNELLK